MYRIIDIEYYGGIEMAFFNKVFASVGIGAATVDTKLEKDTIMPGEMVKGVVEVKGGSIEQKIDNINLCLNTTYLRESDDRKYSASAIIDHFQITEPFVIGANEKKEIPFSFRLSEDTPLSIGKTKIWVTTGLDIKNAVDPTDKDFLTVIPTPLMSGVITAISNLGFRLREAECEEAPHRLRRRFPYVQEFEFVPVSGPFRGKLDELELIFYPANNGHYELLMQIDRKARGLASLFAEALEMDETYVRLTVSNSDLPYLQQKIQSIIQNYS
jgi:sporulation-control protein